MKNLCLIALLFLLSCSSDKVIEKLEEVDGPKILFTTSDTTLQKVYDRAEELAEGNIIDYPDRKVMKEGAKYISIWMETQPMAGGMYAKRNMEIGRNNIEIFLDYQREDGRLPGVIYNREGVLDVNFVQFQGLCLPMPAFELYFLLDKDTAFLMKVYNALEKFDAYLWKTRDSDNNGCLESWCKYDTGEDDCIRFKDFPNGWSFDHHPTAEFASTLTKEEIRIHCKQSGYSDTMEMSVPIESMDIMSYSYSCRDVLAKISKELDNGKEEYWRTEAEHVQKTLRSYLWDEEKMACFDKDKNNETMPVLMHNSIRCMYYGSFDQEMADKFIKYHLLNPEEFWTPMPLPSIAANDPDFKNISGNNWSGQPQGLTYQRSIRAMENYGHYAELTMIGTKFLDVVGDSVKFTQQFDPFTAIINNSKDGYGPSILAALEFISRFHGIHISQDRIHWSCISTEEDYDYAQKWNGTIYRLQTKKDLVTCSINGEEVLSFSKGTRIVTDLDGKPLEVIGIETEVKPIDITASGATYSMEIEPNCVYSFNAEGEITKDKSVEFSLLNN